jgi:hypothetical protein
MALRLQAPSMAPVATAQKPMRNAHRARRPSGQGVGPAHAAENGKDVDQGAPGYPRDEPEGDFAKGRGEQDSQQYDDPHRPP